MINVVAKELLNIQIGDSTLLIFPFSLLLLLIVRHYKFSTNLSMFIVAFSKDIEK
jgi:hypothetical protein